MGIFPPSSAAIPITLVVSSSINHSRISPIAITTVSDMTPFLSQAIVAMRCGMICPIDIYPRIILHRVIIRLSICLDLVHQLAIFLVTAYHRRWAVLVAWVEGLLWTAAPMVTVRQAEVDSRDNNRRYSGTGQNSYLRNTNSQSVPRVDPTVNQKAKLIHFDIHEDVFHDDFNYWWACRNNDSVILTENVKLSFWKKYWQRM